MSFDYDSLVKLCLKIDSNLPIREHCDANQLLTAKEWKLLTGVGSLVRSALTNIFNSALLLDQKDSLTSVCRAEDVRKKE